MPKASYQRNAIDSILDLAQILDALGTKEVIEYDSSAEDPHQVLRCDWELLAARIQLVQAVRKRGPAFALRALMEDWDQPRIVREVY